MKTFLTRFEITDGEHEHTAYGLVKAKNLEEAIDYAESQEHDASFLKEGQEPTFFDYGDGTTSSKRDYVIELTQEQLTVIVELGLAYYMN